MIYLRQGAEFPEVPALYKQILDFVKIIDEDAVIAGGAVRDLYLGKPIKDIDVIINIDKIYGFWNIPDIKKHIPASVIRSDLDRPDTTVARFLALYLGQLYDSATHTVYAHNTTNNKDGIISDAINFYKSALFAGVNYLVSRDDSDIDIRLSKYDDAHYINCKSVCAKKKQRINFAALQNHSSMWYYPTYLLKVLQLPAFESLSETCKMVLFNQTRLYYFAEVLKQKKMGVKIPEQDDVDNHVSTDCEYMGFTPEEGTDSIFSLGDESSLSDLIASIPDIVNASKRNEKLKCVKDLTFSRKATKGGPYVAYDTTPIQLLFVKGNPKEYVMNNFDLEGCKAYYDGSLAITCSDQFLLDHQMKIFSCSKTGIYANNMNNVIKHYLRLKETKFEDYELVISTIKYENVKPAETFSNIEKIEIMNALSLRAVINSFLTCANDLEKQKVMGDDETPLNHANRFYDELERKKNDSPEHRLLHAYIQNSSVDFYATEMF